MGGGINKKKRKTKNKNERKNKKKRGKRISLAFISYCVAVVMRSKAHLFFVYFFERRCLRSLTPTQAPPKMAPRSPDRSQTCSQLEERQTTQRSTTQRGQLARDGAPERREHAFVSAPWIDVGTKPNLRHSSARHCTHTHNTPECALPKCINHPSGYIEYARHQHHRLRQAHDDDALPGRPHHHDGQHQQRLADDLATHLLGRETPSTLGAPRRGRGGAHRHG